MDSIVLRGFWESGRLKLPAQPVDATPSQLIRQHFPWRTDLSGRNSRPTASKTYGFNGDFGVGKPASSTASTGSMERAMGIEPTSEMWRTLSERLLPLPHASHLARGGCPASGRISSRRNDQQVPHR